MSENDDLRAALLRGEHPIDVARLTRGVIRRDQIWMWVLGVLCVIAWMLVVMLPWATILPMLAKVGQHVAQHEGLSTTAPATAPTAEQSREQMIELAKVLKVGTMATFLDSIASMFMAAVCTVSLIILSRRATLRQVNARLGEISDQLRMMAGRQG
jgi:hypothetical protein